MSEMLEKLKAYLDSPEGQAEMAKKREENALRSKIQEGRFEKFERYLQSVSFEELMQRLFSEHDDAYREKCYRNGYEPHPNRKMEFLFEYLQDRISEIHVSEIENALYFHTSTRFFKGYYFTVMYGQGAAYIFFDSTKKRVFTI